jgi:hypothetical protein
MAKAIVADAPHPSTRESRALALAEGRGHEIERTATHVYLVPSCTGASTYRVRYGGEVEACECPDFEFGHTCKHLLAVGIMHASRRSSVREVRTLRVAAGDPFAYAGKRRSCPSCFGGYVTLTVEEDGDERHEAVPCRRCAADAR